MRFSDIFVLLLFDLMDYFIVEVTADSYEKLAVYDSYDEADENLDHFCSVYPHGYIDIFSEEELIAAQ